MEQKYSRVELLALIKGYNKINSDKIKNVDKMNKMELHDICTKYGLIESNVKVITKIDLRNISKIDLHRDIELHFLKQNKNVPQDILLMKKKDLIDYMELNDIQHYTQDLLEQETKNYQKHSVLKNIIIYNIMKYDNIDVSELPDDVNELQQFISRNGLDVNIGDLKQYSVLLYKLYDAFHEFCRTTEREPHFEKLKSFPKIIQHLHSIV